MNHVLVRRLDMTSDAEKTAFAAAVAASDRYFPARVFELPGTQVIVAERWVDGAPEIVMWGVLYPSLVIGSFLPVESASNGDIASALKAVTQTAYTRAHEQGFADVVMFSNTPETLSFANRHGFNPTHTGLRMEVR